MRRLAAALVQGLCAAVLLAAPAQADFSEFEVESAGASLSTQQAGAHADFTVDFKLKSELSGGEVAQTRDVTVELPPGLLGNPNIVPRCTMAQLAGLNGQCPFEAQVGITEILLKSTQVPNLSPIYNMTTPGGDVVARFGFIGGFFPTTINVRVRSEDDYGVTASLEGASALEGLRRAKTTIWGVPASPVHDTERITAAEGSGTGTPPPGGRPSSLPPAPFLSNPTRCGVPLPVTISASSYQLPDQPSSRQVTIPPITGCGKLSFKPSLSATPTNDEAAAPTGLDVEIEVPQDETVKGLATAQMKDARVALPEGMTLAAGAADGLGSCDAEQAGYKRAGSARCPDAAKIGSVELDVPALERPLHGSLYQRTPEPGHLFRVWLVADDLGVHVALPGEVEVDGATGQVTSLFLDNPEVSLRRASLHLFGGPRAPLANPARCGTFHTSWSFVPWSGGAAASGSAPMSITRNCDAGGFGPRISGGSVDPRAGAFSPFVVELTRQSDEENIGRLAVTMPTGLLAKIAGIPLCQDAVAAAGNCPAASRIGSLNAAAGPGSNPLWIPQPGKELPAVFLGGAYKGAPYSLIVRVPAQAGPFDLGTVVVRSAIHVDPATARVTVESDPLPQMLEGVPISYRRIHLEADRDRFTVNPTSCAAKEIRASFVGSSGATAAAAAGYQATECARLRYGPRLSLRFEGGTKRGQNPAVTAVLRQKPGQANTARAAVVLPRTAFIDQAHINNPCTRVQFNANQCPPKSILGTARAVTPLLDEPLKGLVYFRSNGGERELPDIVVDLKGPLRVTLVGFVDSVVKEGSEQSRIRTTFARVPDAPVSKFTMNLYGGDRGLLENSANLCAAPRYARIDLSGQNGRRSTVTRRLDTDCPNRAKSAR